MSDPTRRTVLAGAAGLSAAVALSACGNDTQETGGTPPANNAAGGTLGAVADVPVGSGKIFSAQKVVVTQPTAGQYKAFSSVCTHAGCEVTSVSNGTINCPCHNSQFKIEDGSVKSGPATKPLIGATVKVENGNLILG